MLLAPLASHAACEPGPEVVANPGRYGPYYHICLGLDRAMIDFDASDGETSSGGQFTIRLRREAFPVPAPGCRGDLVLRMPWTSPSSGEYQAKVEKKRRLLAQVRALEGGHDAEGSLPVVVELNPYVKVRESPRSFELTQCNVFFRHANGGYVDHLEPWRPAR